MTDVIAGLVPPCALPAALGSKLRSFFLDRVILFGVVFFFMVDSYRVDWTGLMPSPVHPRYQPTNQWISPCRVLVRGRRTERRHRSLNSSNKESNALFNDAHRLCIPDGVFAQFSVGGTTRTCS